MEQDISAAAKKAGMTTDFNPVQVAQNIAPAEVVSQPTNIPGGLDAAIPEDDPSWYRADGSRKGPGFLGELKFHDGSTSTELSVGVEVNGKEMEIPSLVPTLTPEEIQHLLSGGEPTDEIINKAIEHALMRESQGLSVWAGPEDVQVK